MVNNFWFYKEWILSPHMWLFLKIVKPSTRVLKFRSCTVHVQYIDPCGTVKNCCAVKSGSVFHVSSLPKKFCSVSKEMKTTERTFLWSCLLCCTWWFYLWVCDEKNIKLSNLNKNAICSSVCQLILTWISSKWKGGLFKEANQSLPTPEVGLLVLADSDFQWQEL